MSGLPPQWLGLLKWSLKYNDGTKDTKEVRPMADEDRKFLEQAMKNLVVDENQKMRVGITVLKLPDPPLPENKTHDLDQKNAPNSLISELEALDAEESEKSEDLKKVEQNLEMLDDLVLNGDNAENFCKMGGTKPLLDCVKSKHPSVVQKSCQLIATITQNNPKTQHAFLAAGGLTVLFALFRTAGSGSATDGKTLGKALGAVSALIRHSKAGEQLFKKAQGLIWLLNALSPKNAYPPRVLNKALSLLQHFLDTDPQSLPLLTAVGAPNVIVQRIGHDNIDTREKSYSALLTLCRGSSASAEKARKSLTDGGVVVALESRKKIVEELIRSGDADDKEMYAVENEMVVELLKLLST
mmetsp:Transcript_12699/g.23036  ORF Transcript_12699/g.23036 Transcript_12699/m.23036 type:complete len:355 (-) Transcript_12699:166-1230(-)|eukprot:CAMPEP_0197526662 /NCGR_PEP_ID=MMETSP1318-20131121/18752_1 /TAXON_ID=552666 /ORGANISM="Partenskyella glossopodia, Strain RCC365" /LENGTH=354 /DNA_ID=CAMNT_0043080937 /DNA_START=11 /DNA_END=1075 /DNA_ORIENTATION=-